MLRVHTIRYDESRRRCGPVRARGAGTRRVPEPARFGAVYAPAVRGRESAQRLRSDRSRVGKRSVSHFSVVHPHERDDASKLAPRAGQGPSSESPILDSTLEQYPVMYPVRVRASGVPVSGVGHGQTNRTRGLSHRSPRGERATPRDSATPSHSSQARGTRTSATERPRGPLLFPTGNLVPKCYLRIGLGTNGMQPS